EAVARRVLTGGGVAGLRGPTVARVFPKDATDDQWFALTVVVSEDVLLPAVETLRRAGASEVTATQVRYVFEHRSWTFEALKRQLGRELAAPTQSAVLSPQSSVRVKTTAWSSS